MYRKLTLSFILTACAFAFSINSFATTYVDYGTSNPYTLNNGDSLYIASGTYMGAISGLNSNTAKITINSGATFQPSSFPDKAVATIDNYGTAIFNYNIRTNSNFILNNYGIFAVNGNTVFTGTGQTWTNNYGGVINFNGTVTVNGSTPLNNIINYETITSTGTFQLNSGSQFTNHKTVTVGGNLQVSGGVFFNDGEITTTGAINLNSGASSITNYCKLITSGGINCSNGNITNYSYIWAKNDLGNSKISLTSGTIVNAIYQKSTPMFHGKDLSITGGSITGPASLYFYGNTSISGAGTIGVNVIGTTDTIKMNDITRTSPLTIFDAQGGTVNPNVIYNAWGVPDSTRIWLLGCSVEVIMTVPLAINWNSFSVYLSNETPLLNWSAYADKGTVFEVQRSYDGKTFEGIKNVASEMGRTDYTHNDISVNKNSLLVYYRIKATEPGGNEKYSQTRLVRFNSKLGNLKLAPNPFTSNFIIDYNSRENEDVIVRIFNSAGQQKMNKTISIHSGNNLIDIKETASLSKGIYIVQISNGSTIIASNKLIKQ